MPKPTVDRTCVMCGNPVPTTSRGVTCSYVCRARYREQSRTPDWSRPPREYPAELVERVRHLYADLMMTRAEVQQQIGPGVKVEVIIRRLGISRRAIKRDQRGENNSTWRGLNIEYHTAHDRVRSAKGVPSGHACIDCGGTAADWSYTGDCPDELTDPRTGCRYSADPDRYVPRCKPCHIAFDRERDENGRFTGRSGGAA